MMSKQEKIVCAAVEFEVDSGKDTIMCLGYDNDPRVENHRFHLADYSLNEDESYNETLGFITNRGRFVDPKEAMSIAINNNQIRELSNLYTRWIEWQLVGDERWKDVHECWREMRDKLENRELKPEDLY